VTRPRGGSEPIETAHKLAERSGDMRAVAPNILALEHIARLCGGLLYAATSQIPWAILLERTFEVDVQACKRCDGRLRVRAVVTQPDVARRILDALRNKRGRVRRLTLGARKSERAVAALCLCPAFRA
jgi:hypothetical protein